MKDLYWRNGLHPREEDRVKIHAANGADEDREAAFAILLNVKKKAEYDAAHLALSRIGYLRRHIGLAGGNNWRAKYGDFLEPAKEGFTSSLPTEQKKPGLRLARLVGWFVVLLLCLALLLPLAYLLFSAWQDARLPPL